MLSVLECGENPYYGMSLRGSDSGRSNLLKAYSVSILALHCRMRVDCFVPEFSGQAVPPRNDRQGCSTFGFSAIKSKT